MPELEIFSQEEPEDPDLHNQRKDGYNKTAIQTFVAVTGILIFVVPMVAAIADYWTDLQMFFFIDDSTKQYISNYKDIRSNIRSNTDTNSILICYPNNGNANSSQLYEFNEYIINNNDNSTNTNYVNCTCDETTYSTFTAFETAYCPNGGSNTVASDFTTSNIDSECANGAAYDTDTESICNECTCGEITPFNSESPQFRYSNYIYNIEKDVNDNDKYVRTHCEPEKLYDRVNKGGERKELETNLIDVRNSNAAFLFLSAIWLIAYLMLAGVILFREFCRFICHCCYERARPPINYDEVTWLVFILVMLHLFEDLPQLIITSIFSMYTLEDAGSECVDNWLNQDFVTDVGPAKRTEVKNIFDTFGWDSVIEIFFITSFFHVFVHGFYGVSLVEFRFTKMFENKWTKNVCYFFLAIIFGILSLWLMLVPFWYVVYANAAFFGFTGAMEFVLLCFVLAGGVGWIGVCIMWCVACLCCADGGDAGGDCCG